jgi:PilZ domain
MRKAIFDPASRSRLPRKAQGLTLRFFDLAVPGTIESVDLHAVTFRTDTLAHAKVIRPGTQLTTSYLLAHGLVDARFTVTASDGRLLTLRAPGELKLRQRRQHPRVPVHLPVHVLIPRAAGPGTAAETGTGDPTPLEAMTEDLSLSGALLRFDAALVTVPTRPITALVELDLPSGAVITAGKLVRAWEQGARVRFMELDDEDGDRLASFIELHLS